MGQQLGETRDAMTEDFLNETLPNTAEEVFAERKWNEFYLLFSFREDLVHSNVIRMGKIACKNKPCIMPLNSMCFKVNYMEGLLEPEWILPRDFGFDTTGGNHDKVSELAYSSNEKFWKG